LAAQAALAWNEFEPTPQEKPNRKSALFGAVLELQLRNEQASVDHVLLKLPRYECVRQLAQWPRARLLALINRTEYVELAIAALKACGQARSLDEVYVIMELVSPVDIGVLPTHSMRCQKLIEVWRPIEGASRGGFREVSSCDFIAAILTAVVRATRDIEAARAPLCRLLLRLWLRRVRGFHPSATLIAVLLATLFPELVPRQAAHNAVSPLREVDRIAPPAELSMLERIAFRRMVTKFLRQSTR
jgi:hypothetical protein